MIGQRSIGLGFAAWLLAAGSVGAETVRAVPDDLAGTPIAFFDGRARSTGTITTLFVSTEAFTARFEGDLAKRELTLDEEFTFADGKALQRWALFAHRDGSVSGTVQTEIADGTLMPPVRVVGEYAPDRLVLSYDGYAPNGSDMVLHFHHVMRSQNDGTVTNRVTVSKFYLPLATSSVTFYKPGR
ncbi:DUF3833 family protein [Fulvimarina endophytica]|uniref:DUF3833 family protein n=1 Tax=Fulvimarina endophytica TaxID=2293836 RepID=A0A371X2W6_9HYPH|nr:DUF3833 family protein [Fulvimarina endophytica]RFC63384.1 DUF3833 family protein [Fulvimarina endophytica]